MVPSQEGNLSDAEETSGICIYYVYVYTVYVYIYIYIYS